MGEKGASAAVYCTSLTVTSRRSRDRAAKHGQFAAVEFDPLGSERIYLPSLASPPHSLLLLGRLIRIPSISLIPELRAEYICSADRFTMKPSLARLY